MRRVGNMIWAMTERCIIQPEIQRSVRVVSALAAAAMLILAAQDCRAEPLRVGRPSARGFAGVPLATGVNHGFFQKHGLELELSVFGGGRTAQPITAGGVDISVQPGTEMAFL